MRNNNSNKSATNSISLSSRKGTLKQSQILRKALTTCIVSTTVLTLAFWFWFLTDLIHRHPEGVRFLHKPKLKDDLSLVNRRGESSRKKVTSSSPFCAFRRYPEHRYYKLNDPSRPDFLVSTEYIYGKLPILLKTDLHNPPTKLCVDQQQWLPETVTSSAANYPQQQLTWPFADGTNPSVLTMDRVKTKAPAVADQVLKFHPETHYFVTACMTNSQCTWKDDDKADRRDKFDLPDLNQNRPDTVRTVIQLLDANFVKIAETTVFLERDAAWGRKLRKPDPESLHLPPLDDARLFLHNSSIHISYREGPGFGYESQVLNELHLRFEPSFSAQIRASESFSFCCGRNMALMSLESDDDDSLYSLTWVDPVTVVKVDTAPAAVSTKRQQRRRRLDKIKDNNTQYNDLLLHTQIEQHHRRLLGGKPHKSHIHGTNAFMVPFKDNQFLGVAHFHRPNDRNRNNYARFGHHYTHAFYTVGHDDDSNADANLRFRLTGLSQEFVLPAASIQQRANDDAEIIQFVSGLEYNELQQQIVLAYGINDCEGAVTIIDYEIVESMLVPVESGKQVVDFMKPPLVPNK